MHQDAPGRQRRGCIVPADIINPIRCLFPPHYFQGMCCMVAPSGVTLTSPSRTAATSPPATGVGPSKGLSFVGCHLYTLVGGTPAEPITDSGSSALLSSWGAGTSGASKTPCANSQRMAVAESQQSRSL